MDKVLAQLVFGLAVVTALSTISMVLLLHPGNITAESKDIVIGVSGGLTAAIGVAAHSLFGSNGMESPNGQGVMK